VPAHKIPLQIRFWQKVDKSGDCWLWTGARHPLGYGHIKIDGKVEAAYRIAYEMAKRVVPDGLALDHLCRVPACVNPDHLEPVTLAENTRRGNAPGAVAGRTNRCGRGHEFTPENTYHWRTRRYCRACRADRSRAA